MIRIVGGATLVLALLATPSKCQAPSNGGGAPAGHVYACDTHASAPRLNTLDYPFLAVEGRTVSVCDVPPKSHQVVITLEYWAGGQWTIHVPGTEGSGGTCFSGTDSKNPKPGDCKFAVPCQTGKWKIKADVIGTGPAPDFKPFNWSLPAAEQVEAAIVCPIPKQRKG